uniref:Uncharacterized protein n=1 Tax=Panagrolaimus davidi TaxID=227884 RepID=A0A914PM32_9BILA
MNSEKENCLFYGKENDPREPVNYPDDERFNHQMVCWDRKIFAEAEIRAENLKTTFWANNRGAIKSDARTYFSDIENFCTCDDLGHPFAKEFGGHGDVPNLIQQDRNLNSGKWSLINGFVNDFFSGVEGFSRENEDWDGLVEKLGHDPSHDEMIATMKLGLLYDDGDTDRTRPSSIAFNLIFSEGEEIIKEIFGLVENRSQRHATMHLCDRNANEKLVYFVQKPEYFKECKIVEKPPRQCGLF